MRITQLLVLATVIGFLACGQVGCASAKGVGDEKSSVFQGTQTIVQAEPVTVTSAAKTVVEELQLKVESSVASGLDGKVVARTAKNTKLTVDIKTAGENLSRVTVRAGGFGDKTVQKQVLDRIRAKLPAAPAPAAEEDGGFANAPAAQPQPQAQRQAVTAAPAPKAQAPSPANTPAPQATTTTTPLPF